MSNSAQITPARRASLAIIFLGAIVAYFGWTAQVRIRQDAIFDRYEQILATRDLLDAHAWDSGETIILADLHRYDPDLGREYNYASMIASACAADSPNSVIAVRNCLQKTLPKFFQPIGLDAKDLDKKLTGAKEFELKKLRSQHGRTCNIIIFRGQEKENFWIRTLDLGAYSVKGTSLFYVRLANDCATYWEFPLATSFLLADLREFHAGWQLFSSDELVRAWEPHHLQWRLSIFQNVLSGKAGVLNDSHWREKSFDVDRFLTELPATYRRRFAADLYSHLFYVTPIKDIEENVITEAQMRSGVLHTLTEPDAAVRDLFFEPQQAPRIQGFQMENGDWINIAPFLLVPLSLSFWYQVRRIRPSSNGGDESWVLLETKGYIEGLFATAWALLLVVAPLSAGWWLMVYDHAAFPTFSEIASCLGLASFPGSLACGPVIMPAMAGLFLVSISELLIIHGLYGILKDRVLDCFAPLQALMKGVWERMSQVLFAVISSVRRLTQRARRK